MTEVFTAVSLEQNDDRLDQPLLSNDENDDREEEQQESTVISELYPAFRMHGVIIGFLVQLLNVAGSTVMYYQWNNVGVLSKLSTDLPDTFLHLVVFLITQVDLYLYISMWVALTAVLTQPGMQYVQDNYFAEKSNVSKRSMFVLGVQFYVGVVVGVFLAWTAIDCVLGLPVPVLPMLGVLVFGLLISYTMIFCYDLEDSLDSDENGEVV
jgi:hypothetical protein